MKVISGIYKGKEILVPKSGIRPTSDKVKQSIINILQPRLAGSRFLDLFAGTGAIGIEALSNGASFACFVENNHKSYIILKKNLENIVADKSNYETIKHNATQLVDLLISKNIEPFDIIFADPFYDDISWIFDNLIALIEKFLKNDGVFILEHRNKESFDYHKFFVEKRNYGDTTLSIFQKGQK
ncbi:MAG: 16S rRNA (guanine(966)-N(2))-methyltransferase RsmD [Brevinematia bacterium]